MKISKIILSLWVCVIPITYLSAQGTEAFSSIGASLSATTTGFELELATPLHEKLLVRGGISFFPYNFDETINVRKVNDLNLPTTTPIDMDGEIRLLNGKVLLDFYPSEQTAFSLSAGLYFGKKNLVRIEGLSNENVYWGENELISENGRVKAYIETNNIKPYIGIGFGNAVPQKRVGFRFELGAMFHGTPTLYNSEGKKLSNVNINDTDVIKTINKIKVYPVVAFRLTGRII